MAGPDLNNLLQQYIMLNTLNEQNKLSPDQVTQLQTVISQLQDNPNGTADAITALPQDQQDLINKWHANAAPAPGGGGTAAPSGGGLAPGADGNYNLTPEQLGQLISGAALNQGGQGGGNLSISTTVAGKQAEQTQARTTAVNYVDLPTPAEVLDNWDNAFQMHLNGLVQSGAISPAVAEFAKGQTGVFYGDYLREQIGRALKGEPMYKVAGLDANNQLIGARQGAYQTGQTTTEQQTAEQLQQSSSGGGSISGIALDSLLRQTTPGSSVGTSARVNAALGGGGSSLSIGSTGTESMTGTSLQSQQEAIVSRNKLMAIANLSPLDFLGKGVDATRLNMLYGGQKGTAAREGQTALGEAPAIQARRQ
jgi:hypothetical protein